MPVSNPIQVDWTRPGAIGSVIPNTIAATSVSTFQATAADQYVLTRANNPSYSLSINNFSFAIKEIASGKLLGAYKLDSGGFPILILGADAGAGVLSKSSFRSASVTAFTAVNLSGSSLTIALGAGVGTGALPDISFDTPNLVASGTGQQTTTTKMTLKGRGSLLIGTATDNNADLLQVNGSASFAGAAKLAAFTVATVPSAAANTSGLIHISNESGGATPAFSDGTNWRRVHDRAIIS